MSFSVGLANSNTQSLVITTRLLQSIKLLQYNNVELTEFIRREAEKNPFLEVSSDGIPLKTEDPAALPVERGTNPKQDTDSFHERPLNLDVAPIPSPVKSSNSGTVPKTAVQRAFKQSQDKANIEAFCAAKRTLRDHLMEQLPLAASDRVELAVAREIVESLDSDGYFRRPVDEISELLNVSDETVLRGLDVVQSLDPAGVGARDLAECLRLQLIASGEDSENFGIVLENLEALARLDFDKLAQAGGLTKKEVVSILARIRQLDPRPGLQFDASPIIPAVPDVVLGRGSDGDWLLELNNETLPRVLVNQTYYAKISGDCRTKDDKRFVTTCIGEANWLVRNIEQRANTILKVASEIVSHQREFFDKGVGHLKPLKLKTIADAIDMHQSTVSRATANKYIMTNRGLFELKFFFCNSIASNAQADGGMASESVRHRIQEMIEAETVDTVLSDEAIVERLGDSGITIARRTVAKYRDAMNIPSSTRRRRQMRALCDEAAA